MLDRRMRLQKIVVVRREPRSQLRIADLAAQLKPGVQLLPPGPAAVARDAERHRLEHGVEGAARELLERRHTPVELPHRLADLEVGMGDHPRRRPLEQVEPARRAAGSRARPGSRRRRCRAPPPACRPGRRSGPSSAVWKALPSKRSRPGSAGVERLAQEAGRRRPARARRAGPADVSSSQCWPSATQRAP